MYNCSLGIFSIVENMCDIFENKSFFLNDYEQKNSFVSELNTLFDALYDSLKNIPDDFKRDNIFFFVNMKQKIINTSLSLISDDSIEFAKKNILELAEYLKNNIDIINLDNKKIDYLNKLAVYKNSISRHKKLEKNYKNGNINYGIYIGSYNTLISLYKELVNSYNILGDFDLEKPKPLKMIPKSVDDLLIKDMKQEQIQYQQLCDYYEGEIYSDYVEITEEYNKGGVSEEDYAIEASNCLNHYVILNNEYDRLQNQFILYKEMFASEVSEYNMATEEELTNFYSELEEYNKLIAKYKSQLNDLENIFSDAEKGIILDEEYEKKLFVLEELDYILSLKRKELVKKRGKIYNNTSLSMLKKHKDIIENNLKNINLTELEKEKLNDDLKEIKAKIVEINRFKSTLMIKTFKKTKKNVNISRNQKSKEKLDYFGVNKLEEPYFLENNTNVLATKKSINIEKKVETGKVINNISLIDLDDENDKKIIDGYNRILDIYNEQLYVFYEKEKKFLNGDIPYDGEYEKAAVYTISLYKKIKSEYDAVYRFYEKRKKEEKLDFLQEPQQPIITMGNEDEEKKIVTTTDFEWKDNRKKKILITLGLLSLAASIFVSVTQLLPAFMKASQALKVDGMFSQMILNAKMWHKAIASERIALHSANTALASQISAITEMSNDFNTANGVWTMGSDVLEIAATKFSLVASRTVELVNKLKCITLASSFGGLGLVGAGILLKDKVNESYKKKVRFRKK